MLERNATISQQEFENCWESNKDGGGYTFIGLSDKGTPEFKVKKSLDFEDFRTAFEHDLKSHGAHSKFLLHFRAKSQGSVSIANCHPFFPSPDVSFIHNGTIWKMPNDSLKSDTMLFEEFLSTLPRGWTSNKTMITLIQEFVGANNKIAFMTLKEKLLILNEKDWEKDEGRLFSNKQYKDRRIAPGTKSASGLAEEEWDYYGVPYFGGGYYNRDSKRWSTKTPVEENKEEKKVTPLSTTSYRTLTDTVSGVYHRCEMCRYLVPHVNYNFSLKICENCKAMVVVLSKKIDMAFNATINLLIKLYKVHDVEYDKDDCPPPVAVMQYPLLSAPDGKTAYAPGFGWI